MSTLVFTANEMLRRRKREPFNFISPAPPRLSTPSSDEAPRKRSPSMFYERPRARLASQLARMGLLPRESACVRSRGLARLSSSATTSPSAEGGRLYRAATRVSASRDRIPLKREERRKRSDRRQDGQGSDIRTKGRGSPSDANSPIAPRRPSRLVSRARLRSFYWVTPFLC